jgi:hypothetical protein
MGFDEIQTACVIRYAYVWSHEAARGETEGRKARPPDSSSGAAGVSRIGNTPALFLVTPAKAGVQGPAPSGFPHARE